MKAHYSTEVEKDCNQLFRYNLRAYSFLKECKVLGDFDICPDEVKGGDLAFLTEYPTMRIMKATGLLEGTVSFLTQSLMKSLTFSNPSLFLLALIITESKNGLAVAKLTMRNFAARKTMCQLV